ncbi:hypothetical protein HK099_008303 [Clydaea vesicula]|uniref:Uncharacterized protein n=1 Tax=Clydaea vesicula TaxID=447962 RepID=A0AAD5U7S9_9FUNG|nr:hypothetical protein HK099_008303 [Clydaea vesicula]KAJ3383202.1 hypothetical protein HDU92_004349 [Lobulomyces angularis]
MALNVQNSEVESIQLQKLEAAFSIALNATLNTCSEEAFIKSFKNLHESHPAVIPAARQQILGFLAKESRVEFDRILHERDIPKKLKELDEAILKSKTSGDKYVSLLNLDPIEATLDQQKYLKKLEILKLREILKKYNEDNINLEKNVIESEKRLKIEKGKIEDIKATLLTCSEMMEKNYREI